MNNLTTAKISDGSVSCARLASTDEDSPRLAAAMRSSALMFALIEEFYSSRRIRRAIYGTGLFGTDWKARRWALAEYKKRIGKPLTLKET